MGLLGVTKVLTLDCKICTAKEIKECPTFKSSRAPGTLWDVWHIPAHVGSCGFWAALPLISRSCQSGHFLTDSGVTQSDNASRIQLDFAREDSVLFLLVHWHFPKYHTKMTKQALCKRCCTNLWGNITTLTAPLWFGKKLRGSFLIRGKHWVSSNCGELDSVGETDSSTADWFCTSWIEAFWTTLWCFSSWCRIPLRALVPSWFFSTLWRGEPGPSLFLAHLGLTSKVKRKEPYGWSGVNASFWRFHVRASGVCWTFMFSVDFLCFLELKSLHTISPAARVLHSGLRPGRKYWDTEILFQDLDFAAMEGSIISAPSIVMFLDFREKGNVAFDDPIQEIGDGCLWKRCSDFHFRRHTSSRVRATAMGHCNAQSQ